MTRVSDAPAREAEEAPSTLAAWGGLVTALLLVAVAFWLPRELEWDVRARMSAFGIPPLHGLWDPKVGIGTAPTLVLAVLAVAGAGRWALVWRWRVLLPAVYAGSLAWLVALALVDGVSGLTRTLDNDSEYMVTAKRITDVGAMLHEYVDRIPFSAADNWPIHVSGHPPGAVLMYIGLDRVGLGGDLAAATVITLVAALTPVLVLVTLRCLGMDRPARLAAPFLVFSPAAIFMAVSADALFTTCAAGGLAALAASATAAGRGGLVGWGVLAGLLLGWCVMSSYGLPLLGVLAVAVLVLARSWRPLLIAAAAALLVVLGFAAAGFAWWEAYPVLHDRYWEGMARERPASYWLWGNLAALVVCAGPLLGAGLAHAPTRLRDASVRPLVWLALAAALVIVVADLSRMSKAEVERIWLPFVPWLTLSMALLPSRWLRLGLALQVASAVVVQHLLYTSW